MCRENMAVEREEPRRADRTKRRRVDGASGRRCKRVATAAGSMAPANTTQYLMELAYEDLTLSPGLHGGYLPAGMDSVRELRFHGD